MKGVFVPSVVPPLEKMGPAWWFMFRRRKLLVRVAENLTMLPPVSDVRDLGVNPVLELYLGTLDEVPCYAADIDSSSPLPEGMECYGLRALHGHLEEDLFKVAFRALHVIEWDKTDQYCTRCGTRNVTKEDVRAKVCPQCNALSFPRISPAVIVLVQKGNQVLLARAARFTEEMYSVLAGFVEPGETLEEVVRREVKEETGIDVTDIRYFGSQPWPFPDSLMIGFTAQYAGGECRADGDEILDARWFDRNGLPRIPDRISIARSLIDWFIAQPATEE